jgi:hypothetical protein
MLTALQVIEACAFPAVIGVIAFVSISFQR